MRILSSLAAVVPAPWRAWVELELGLAGAVDNDRWRPLAATSAMRVTSPGGYISKVCFQFSTSAFTFVIVFFVANTGPRSVHMLMATITPPTSTEMMPITIRISMNEKPAWVGRLVVDMLTGAWQARVGVHSPEALQPRRRMGLEPTEDSYVPEWAEPLAPRRED